MSSSVASTSHTGGTAAGLPAAVARSPEMLSFTIDSCSSHSAQYLPGNILENKPTDQASRWSSGSNNQLQYITAKLENLSIAYQITLGKFSKPHVCNLKEFKVFGGLTPECTTELLHSGLRNDDEPETFVLKYTKHDITFPVQYIKIVPIAAWGSNFNFSIWYVEVTGTADQSTVNAALSEYNLYREREAIRLCLKHLRQRNYLDAFESLEKRSKVPLEDPLMTQLHDQLVKNGDFQACEETFAKARNRQLFTAHISDCKYCPRWSRLDKERYDVAPGMRGGHQMCIDQEGGKIYLFGGWDGTRDLADFWCYDTAVDKWSLLSSDTSTDGGPGARSCHKLCYDQKRNLIYTLGRYVDPSYRDSDGANLNADFYYYDVDNSKWWRLSDDTHADGGPELIYDHQMVMDSDRQMLYVFGGRTITTSTCSENVYSGLFSYDAANFKWSLLRNDSCQTVGTVHIKSRIGHAMVLHPVTRKLYIFAGQRNRDYLSDFYVYDIDTDTVAEMSRDSSKQGGPDAGFTQRATIDTQLDELYVLSGLMREKNSSTETAKNSFWVYNIHKDRWSQVYQNECTCLRYWNKMQNLEPCPRYAHQLVYDSIHKTHYMFGGNPGEVGHPTERLDDFWSLALLRPDNESIYKRAKFLLRKQQFIELCGEGNSIEALKFLQTRLAECVDHNDTEQSGEFRKLTAAIFQKRGDPSEVFNQRTQLYEDLLVFFPEELKQPSMNLVDHF